MEIDSREPYETTTISNSNIIVVNNFIDDEFCDEIITQFENNSELGRLKTSNNSNYTELNISQNPNQFEEYTNFITDRFKEAIGFYAQQLDIRTQQWPIEYGYEEFNMVKFAANEGHMGAQVAAFDLVSSKRFLQCSWFLNEPPEGGNFEMYINDTLIDIKPQKGRVILFPSVWTHPYAVKTPLANQYMISSYLHYI